MALSRENWRSRNQLAQLADPARRYRVAAKLHLFDGVVAGPCLAAAKNNLAAYLLEQKKLARSIRRDNYKAVLRVAGVDWVELLEPAVDVLMDKSQSGYCTATDITIAGDANE